jgi:hypothetical protein
MARRPAMERIDTTPATRWTQSGIGASTVANSAGFQRGSRSRATLWSRYRATSANTAMLRASETWPLRTRARLTARVAARPRTGVPVRSEMIPIHPGARPSRTSTRAMREGTSMVALSDVARAMTAPRVTNAAAPACR